VLLLHDGPGASALAEGLRVELAAARAEVQIAAAPTGETPLVRAANAQATARAVAAAFAIWVERQPTEGAGDLLRVVDAETDHVRDAPLPSPVGEVPVRTFAAVAASLIGELQSPVAAPSGPVRVHVRVETPSGDVEVDAVANEASPGTLESAESLAAPVIVVPAPAGVASATSSAGAMAEWAPEEEASMPRTGFVLGASVLTAVIATGAEIGIGYYVSRFLRLELFGAAVVHYLDEPAAAGNIGLSLTRVGAARSGRFDAGGFVSFLLAGDGDGSNTRLVPPAVGSEDPVDAANGPSLGVVTGAHFGWMWERSRGFALGFRLAGGISLVQDDFDAFPFGMLSFRTEFAP
jgi:hypothetical protein